MLDSYLCLPAPAPLDEPPDDLPLPEEYEWDEEELWLLEYPEPPLGR